MFRKLIGVVLLVLMLVASIRAQDDTTLEAEEITFTSGDITLAGTLVLPDGEPPYPAVVIVHGSEEGRRFGYVSWLEPLVERGFAVLRYDKRGVGDSEGTFKRVNAFNSEDVIGQLAADAAAGVAYLAQHPAIDPDRIGLMGASQAGWIIPLAAGQSEQVAFMLIISGPTVSIGEENYYSVLAGDEINETDFSPDTINEQLAAYGGTRGYDPMPILTDLDVPGLWIYGLKDYSQPSVFSINLLSDLIETTDKPFTIFAYENANHGIYDVDSGERMPYFEDVIDDWLIGILENPDPAQD